MKRYDDNPTDDLIDEDPHGPGGPGGPPQRSVNWNS